MMNNAKDKLLDRIIEAIYGKYDDFNKEDDYKNITSFTERLTKWKSDKKFRKVIGPLQPAFIFSKMFKLSEDKIKKIAKDIGVRLPTKVNFKEFDLNHISNEMAESILLKINDSTNPEEEILNFLTSIEKARPFEFVDLTTSQTIEYDDRYEGTLRAVSYLQDLAKKHRKNEVHCMTVVALLKNGKVSMWVPESIELENSSNDVYDELIKMMSTQDIPSTGQN